MNDQIPSSDLKNLTNSEKKDLQKKKNKRLQELLKWLSYFQQTVAKKKQLEINFIDDIKIVANKINNRYWEIIEKDIRIELETRKQKVIIHHSKIISVLQLTIMEVLPLEGKDEEQTKELNALLALFIGRLIVFQWPKNKEIMTFPELEDFEEEHLKWLVYREIEYFPVFSNSFTWLLYSKLYNQLIGKKTLGRIFMIRN